MARANALYYATQDPFRDFTTAPEITQVFGELIGAWFVLVWRQLGCPDPVMLVECGPGRGTLMTDLRRCIGQVAPDLVRAAHVHMIETSPRLRAIQHAAHPDACFHDDIGNLPAGAMLLVANEFLDALPIRQFVSQGAGWTERFVKDGCFIEQPSLSPVISIVAPEGAIVEQNDAALRFAACLGRRLATQSGAALLIDYGPMQSGVGSSLQALRAGQAADPLLAAGYADLTAHVDFAAIARAAAHTGAHVFGPTPQGAFLTRLGLFPRTHQLARTQTPDRAVRLIQAASRLAEPEQMGQLFKVLALCHPAMDLPPGFEP